MINPPGSWSARLAIEKAGRDEFGDRWQPGQHLVPEKRRYRVWLCVECGVTITPRRHRCPDCGKEHKHQQLIAANARRMEKRRAAQA